jgi:hypothetical protein
MLVPSAQVNSRNEVPRSSGSSGAEEKIPRGERRQALQARLDRPQRRLAQRKAARILCVIQLHAGGPAFPRHPLGPRRPRVDSAQERPLPRPRSQAPAPLKRRVFAGLGRVREYWERVATLGGTLPPVGEGRRAACAAFGALLPWEWEVRWGVLLVSGQGPPAG